MSLMWNDLFKAGSVVDLNVKIWGARVKLRPEDLGIANSAEVHKVLLLGSNRLLPRKAFAEILNHVHDAERSLRYYSVNFPFIHGARYVPENNMEALLARLNEAQQKFNNAVNVFVRRYTAEKELMLPIIEKALKDASKSEEAARRAFERIQSEYPSSSEVKNRFQLTWSIYSVSGAASGSVAAAAAQEAENVRSVVTDMVKQLRDELLDQTQKIISQINRGGRVQARTAEATTQLLDRLDSLNVLGDQVLTQQINMLRKALSSWEDNKAPDGANKGLEAIKQELSASVDKAVADAEKVLTGLGRRKLTIVKKEVR